MISVGEGGRGSAPDQEARLSGADLRAVLESFDFPVVQGVDFAASFATTALLESAGDPDAVVPEARGGHSYGLFQVYDQAHPELAARVLQTIESGLAPIEKARLQVRLLLNMMGESVQEATRAAVTLRSRGFEVTHELVAGLIDAVWQRGPHAVLTWAERTTTGALRELHDRLEAFERMYRQLARAVSFGLLIVGGIGLALLALALRATWRRT